MAIQSCCGTTIPCTLTRCSLLKPWTDRMSTLSAGLPLRRCFLPRLCSSSSAAADCGARSILVAELRRGAARTNVATLCLQVHPWGPTGHRLLAELLIRLVQATAVGLSIQPLAASEAQLPREQLVPPLTPGNYETNTSSCWLGVSGERGLRSVLRAFAAMACTVVATWQHGDLRFCLLKCLLRLCRMISTPSSPPPMASAGSTSGRRRRRGRRRWTGAAGSVGGAGVHPQGLVLNPQLPAPCLHTPSCNVARLPLPSAAPPACCTAEVGLCRHAARLPSGVCRRQSRGGLPRGRPQPRGAVLPGQLRCRHGHRARPVRGGVQVRAHGHRCAVGREGINVDDRGICGGRGCC